MIVIGSQNLILIDPAVYQYLEFWARADNTEITLQGNLYLHRKANSSYSSKCKWY